MADVVVNITAVDAAGAGFVNAYPYGSTIPVGSALNYTTVGAIAQLVTVPVTYVNGAGYISVRTSSLANVIVDVFGYHLAAGTQGGGAGLFTGLATPTRAYDTRNKSKIGQNQSRPMCVGPPNSYANVMLNVTGLNATQTTFLTVYASGSALPNVSNINLAPGDVRPNLVYSKMDANGCINVFNSVGSVDVLVDVLGYTSSTGTSKFAPVPSTRIVDSRTNMGTVGAWASNENRFVTIAQASNNPVVPAGATYALVNITATSTLATGFTPGFATIYNGNGTPPATSTLNYPTVGTATNNHAIVPLNYGAFRIFNASGGSTNFIVDVEGYYY